MFKMRLLACAFLTCLSFGSAASAELFPGIKTESRTSALDGRTDHWLEIRSQNTQRNSIGMPEKATLQMRCMENTTSAIIQFNTFISDGQRVRYRIDSGAVQWVWMEPSRDASALGLWNGAAAIPFIRSLFSSWELVVRFDSFSSAGLEFTFQTAGLQHRIDALARECGWKNWGPQSERKPRPNYEQLRQRRKAP